MESQPIFQGSTTIGPTTSVLFTATIGSVFVDSEFLTVQFYNGIILNYPGAFFQLQYVEFSFEQEYAVVQDSITPVVVNYTNTDVYLATVQYEGSTVVVDTVTFNAPVGALATVSLDPFVIPSTFYGVDIINVIVYNSDGVPLHLDKMSPSLPCAMFLPIWQT